MTRKRCPVCDEPIGTLAVSGPSEATAGPCGHTFPAGTEKDVVEDGGVSLGHVYGDRDDQDADLLVVGFTSAVANEYDVGEIDGEPRTVADYNTDYPEDDPVVEVVYLSSLARARDIEEAKRYAFPVSRLVARSNGGDCT